MSNEKYKPKEVVEEFTTNNEVHNYLRSFNDQDKWVWIKVGITKLLD
jgi:hypothetical protein